MSIRHVVRRLAQLPMFTSVAVITLAVGIGANAAIFSVVEGVLLKPLPYLRAEELVVLDHGAPGINLKNAGAAPFLYFTYRAENRSFQDVGLWTPATVSVTGDGAPEEVRIVLLTDGVLPLFGVQPMLGRLFTGKDDAPGAAETTVLSAGYWRLRFGADPSVIGRRILLDGRAREVIGVLPDSFHFLETNAVLFVPLRLNPAETTLGNFSYTAMARLKPGVSMAQAAADVARMIPIALHRFPPVAGFSLKMFEDARITPDVRSLKSDVVGDVGSVLWVLMGTIGMVLLIACANVASLLLVRADARQQELAIRAAIGAGRGHIARELLAESVVLGVLGGALGLGLASGGLRLLVAAAPANLPRVREIAIDPMVVLFTAAISIGAGLLFGALPVLRYAGPHVGSILRGGGRTSSHSRERHRARNALVIVQVALALLLLISAGLMIRTFQALKRIDPGFVRPSEVLTLRISIPATKVPDKVAVARMQQAIIEKIAAIPGVSSVGISSVIPMNNQGWTDPIFAEDHRYAEGQIPPIRRFKFVSPGLLKTMGNRVVAGRDFTWTDVFEMRRVAMVSENLARELWGDPAAAVGKRIGQTPTSPFREIVGVVSDERDDGFNKRPPAIAFWPMLMDDFADSRPFVQRVPAYMIRSTRAGTRGFVDEVGRAVWSIDPDLPLAAVRTLEEVTSASLARTSFTLVMLAIAGGMALLLGFAGIYGVIAYSVSQRTREIGIRVALGAQRGAVTRMFVRNGVTLAALGVACGLAAALALTRTMSSLLFGVTPFDPMTFGGVSVALLAAATVASYVPALRAATVEPVHALRAE